MRTTWFRAMRASALAAACFLAGAAPFAQQPFAPQSAQPPAGPATGIIVGRVIDAMTKAPLANVQVGLDGGAPGGRSGTARRILTDAQGRFVFPNLAAGIYRIISQPTGYLQAAGGFSPPIALAASERITDLFVRMYRLSSISGTVTDENGDPAVGVAVMAYRRDVVNGRAVTIPSREARTDDRGAYRITDMAKGEYVVCACRQDPLPVDGVLLSTLAADPVQLLALATRALKVGADAASIENAMMLAPVFYPSSRQLSGAATIALAHEDRTGVDIQMPVARASRVSGRIVGANGSVSANQIRMRLVGDAPEMAIAIEPMLVQPDGRFDFVGIPPGTYAVSGNMLPGGGTGPSGLAMSLAGARGMPGPPPPPPPPLQQGQIPPTPSILWGQTIVTVGDADISGVIVQVQRLHDVAVKVETPAGFVVRNGQPPVRAVQFSSLRAGAPNVPMNTRTEQNGVFLVPNIAPGSYTIAVTAVPGLSVTSIELGGREMIDQPIEIGNAAPDQLVVTMEELRRATVDGKVAGVSDDSTVLMFPTDQRLWAEPGAAQRWFSSLAVDRAGKFNASLIAGDYFVIAISVDDVGNWQARARLESLAARAQKISVAAGETKSIEVKR